jgi:hypothetical protein
MDATIGAGRVESGRAKKEQVVETTCESHEKTSIGNF